MKRRWVLGGLLVGGLGALVVAYARRTHGEDVLYAFTNAIGGTGDDVKLGAINTFDPFRLGHAYLWLGLAIGLLVGCAALAVQTRRRGAPWRYAPHVFALVAMGAGVAAFLQRGDVESSLGGIEGAYFDLSVGSPAYAGELGQSMFNPFMWGNAYLWLGLAVGLLGAGVASRVLQMASTQPTTS